MLKAADKLHTKLIIAIVLVLAIPCFLSSNDNQVFAASKYTPVASFKLKKKWWGMGAILTKKYFMYTEQELHVPDKQSRTYLVRCLRSDLKNCKRSSKSYKYGHVLTLLHSWGTDYVLVRADYGVNAACWSASQFKPVSMSNCSWKDNGSPRLHMKTYHPPQGYTKYKQYYIRVFGNKYHINNYRVVLYNSKYKVLRETKLPTNMYELEDVMVDEDTGIVYFTSVYTGKNRRMQLNKLTDPNFYIWPTNDKDTQSGTTTSKTNSNSSAPTTNSSAQTYTPSQSTYDGSVSTIFFGDIQDDGKGCGVYTVLNLILDILTYGVGIAAVIGIGISGIMYLTSKGNEANTTKAKRRIYEIVIGLAAYAVLYVALNFLLPGGNWNTSNACKQASNSASTAKLILG